MKVSFASSIGTSFSFITTFPVASHQAVLYATLAASHIKHHLSQATTVRYRKLIKSSGFTAKRLTFHLILFPCPRMPSTSDSRTQGGCVQTGNISVHKQSKMYKMHLVVSCLATGPLSNLYLHHNSAQISIVGIESVLYINICMRSR